MNGFRLYRKKTVPYGWAVLIAAFLYLPQFADITIEPNGVLSRGTSLTVHIALERGQPCAVLEIVADENANARAESDERRVLEKTTVMDGTQSGEFKDHCSGPGMIELHLRISTSFKEGKYIIRAIPAPGRLADKAVFEVKHHSDTLLSWINRFIISIPKMIKDPPPASELARKIPANTAIQTDLWLMHGKGYEIVKRLTNTCDCTNPAWSPDSKGITYVRTAKNRGQLWTINLDDNGKPLKSSRLLSKFPGTIANPVWSRKGDRIAFLSGDEIWAAAKDGTGAVKITLLKGVQKIIAWNESDSAIICSVLPGTIPPILSDTGVLSAADSTVLPEDRAIHELWLVDAGTGKKERLIYDHTWHWLRRLAPDGKRVLCSIITDSGRYRLWLREGDNFIISRKLTGGNYFDSEPAWSPDGRWIVFVSDRENRDK